LAPSNIISQDMDAQSPSAFRHRPFAYIPSIERNEVANQGINSIIDLLGRFEATAGTEGTTPGSNQAVDSNQSLCIAL
jgi:hypothetical protein